MTEKAGTGSPLNLFIPITKVDVAQRLVYGVATAEQPDRSGEICDYESTKPHYEAWSADIEKASDGKSLGNLRAMHGKVAAGKLTAMVPNDADKQIEICAKVVDDNEWGKVLEGVYTGFSQGGSYERRWKDEATGLMRYTAVPVEVSLVDVPCLPNATFEVVKADGASELRKFKEAEAVAEPSNADVAEFAKALAKAAGDESKWPDHLEAAGLAAAKAIEGGWKAGDPPPAPTAEAPQTDVEKAAEADPTPEAEGVVEKGAEAAPAEPEAELEQVWKCADGSTFKTKAEARAHNAEAMAKAQRGPADEAIDALSAALGKADLSAEGRKAEAKSGEAMADGTFPIKTAGDVKNAVADWGRSGSKAAVKRHIIKRAKAIGATDELPADWLGSTKEAAAETDGLEKSASLYTLADLLNLLSALQFAEDCFEQPNYWGDVQDMPSDLKDRFGALVVELGDITASALDVVLAAMKDEERTEAMQHAALVGDLLKAGARHSKSDKSHLQGAHDALVKLGAACADMGKAAEAEELEKAADALAKRDAELAKRDEQVERLAKLAGEAVDTIKALKADVEMLKAQPAGGGPARFQINVLPEASPAQAAASAALEELQRVAASGNPDAMATAMLKFSQQRPLAALDGMAAPFVVGNRNGAKPDHGPGTGAEPLAPTAKPTAAA